MVGAACSPFCGAAILCTLSHLPGTLGCRGLSRLRGGQQQPAPEDAGSELRLPPS